MTTPDGVPVPAGWVRLTVTGESTRNALFSARHIVSVRDSDGRTYIDTVEQQEWNVAESPADVASLIAAAEAKERRAKALPVMAAILTRSRWEDAEAAPGTAAAILDAIERRGEG